MDDPILPSLIPQDELDASEHEHWGGLWNEKLCASIEENFIQDQLEWESTPEALRKKLLPNVGSLFKYRSFDHQHPERTKEILTESKLWSSSLHSLNDPMEAGFTGPDDSIEARAAFAFVYMMRSQWSGCISFSLNPVSKLMWSHYSGNHTGFCIEYKRKDSALLSYTECRPVFYRSHMPKVDLDPNSFRALTDIVFWTKSEAWEYEREWRLRYPRIDAYTRAGLIKPHAVIFGLKCAPEVRKFIKDCSPGLRYGEIDASSHDYHLTIVWEDNATEIDDPEDEPSVELSEMLEKVLAMTIDVARGLLERFGEFAPFGLVIHQNQADFLMIENPAAAEAEGIQGHQLMRRVEELVREARDRQQLDFAGIITDINVWPVDGGPMTSAIQGRIEERGGLAVQFLQHYEIRNDVLSLGEKWIFPKDHLLLP